jgi:hypothetical protein
MGLAVPVVDVPMAEVTIADAGEALRVVQRERHAMRDALSIAAGPPNSNRRHGVHSRGASEDTMRP